MYLLEGIRVGGLTISSIQGRNVAFNTQSLGTIFVPRNSWQRSFLIVQDAAYTEFSAGRPGQVLIEYDVDIKENTNYFHAFIDPCLISVKNIVGIGNETGTENSTATISSISKDLSGVFNASPNPFSDDIALNYEVRNDKGNQVSIFVYNAMGQLVDKIRDNVFHNKGVFSTTYDAHKLSSGIYLFELNIDGEKFLKKVFKTN